MYSMQLKHRGQTGKVEIFFYCVSLLQGRLSFAPIATVFCGAAPFIPKILENPSVSVLYPAGSPRLSPTTGVNGLTSFHSGMAFLEPYGAYFVLLTA